jgi:hypothetical protein
MEGALVCGLGEVVGGKQRREIFGGVAAFPLPLVERVGVEK